MTDQTENQAPSGANKDAIKHVLQDTLMQQVVALLRFTSAKSIALQIPETDTHVFAGPLDRIAELLQFGCAQREDKEGVTSAQIAAAGRALADRSADSCGVNRDDNWMIYGAEFIEDARVAFAAANKAAPAAPVQIFAELSQTEIPANVRAALDRMCSPLDESRLSGVTAQEDARCMRIIREYIESEAAPVQADQAQEEPVVTCEHCGTHLPLHLLTCPVAVRGMAEGKKKEAPEPLRQLLIDLSNNTYFCGLHLNDDAKYAGYLAEAEKAEQALINLFVALPTQAKQVAAVRAAEWISVEDRLPEPGARVLVTRFAGRVANASHPGYPGVPWIEVTRYMANGSMFECDIVSTGYVTHWMPIPAAPSTTPSNDTAPSKE